MKGLGMCGEARRKEDWRLRKRELTKRTSAVACKSSNCHFGTAAGKEARISIAGLNVFVAKPIVAVELLWPAFKLPGTK